METLISLGPFMSQTFFFLCTPPPQNRAAWLGWLWSGILTHPKCHSQSSTIIMQKCNIALLTGLQIWLIFSGVLSFWLFLYFHIISTLNISHLIHIPSIVFLELLDFFLKNVQNVSLSSVRGKEGSAPNHRIVRVLVWISSPNPRSFFITSFLVYRRKKMLTASECINDSNDNNCLLLEK